MQQTSTPKSLSKIKISRIILPSLIGFGVVVFLILRDFNPQTLESIKFTKRSVFWISIAFLLMFLRDFGYILRIKILTENKINWLQAFRIIFLWEFTSAITPSAIGGTGVAVLYINKENIPLGKSTSVVMATSFLDELYFIIMFPLLLILMNNLLFTELNTTLLGLSPLLVASLGYSIKLLWVILTGYGLFINPKGVKWLILKIFKLPFLRKWRTEAGEVGSDIIISSNELKKKKTAFWLKALGVTFVSWTSRYWVLNALFLAFFTVKDHFLLFARQLVMWIMMLVSPTPGGSGFSEYVFTEYLSDFLPSAGLIIIMALIWRLVTYYPYLFIGVFIFPKWINLKFRKKRNS